MKKLGVLGGTFDPIHYAHLFMAECVADLEKLDRVLFVPVGQPAHRVAHASADDRAAMVRLAIAGNPKFELDDAALEQAGPVYTADTLALMRARRPNDEFYFIAGSDSLVQGPWRRLDQVLSALSKFVVVHRPGVSPNDLDRSLQAIPEALRSRIVRLELPLMDISATDMRQRVAGGFPIRYLTPDSVADYIRSKGLYRR